MKPSLLIILLACFSISAQAQSLLGWKYNDRYFSAFIGTGRAGYIGELSHGKPLTGGLSLVNAGVEVRLLSRLGAKFQAARYKLSGSDANAADSSAHQQRNLSFFSNNTELSLQAVYYLFPYAGKYYKRRTYEPYLAAGIAYHFFNPKARLDGEEYVLSEFSTERSTYAKSGLVIPLSLGVKAKLNEFMSLNLDLGWRFTFTDYLDDVSGKYGGPHPDGSLAARLTNRKNEIPRVNDSAYHRLVPGADRGNPKDKDRYFLVNFSIEVYLPRDLLRSRGSKTRKERIIGKPGAY